MRHLKTFLTVIGAVTILVLAANSAVYAATGGKFILGKKNTANNVSTLKRTTAGPALKLKTATSGSAPLAVTGTGKVANLNVDKLDDLDSSAFLRAGATLKFSEQRGWLHQNGGTGVVGTFSNVQTLEGDDAYYLPLTSPNVLGSRQYYMDSVEICYNMFSGGQLITTTRIFRSTVNNSQDTPVTNSTDRTSAYPTTECYTVAVNDTAAPAGSVYTLALDVIGSARIVRVTTTYKGK
jgi:hypothetical protein